MISIYKCNIILVQCILLFIIFNTGIFEWVYRIPKGTSIL